MSFTDEQVAALKAPLSRAHVRQRSHAGRQLSFLEGWKVIEEANRIFGFDGWDRETIDLRELGDARQVDGKWRVAYMARVRITVRPPQDISADVIRRDGCGYGSGIDRDLGSAHESALREAETDAMKRALMTFGNPFGLALYDKDQAQVSDDARPNGAEPAVKSSAQAKRDGIWDQIHDGLAKCPDSGALLKWAADQQPMMRTLSSAWQEQARETWGTVLAGKLINECHTPPEVAKWALEFRRPIEALPIEWINTARAVCKEHLEGLKRAQPQEAAE